MILFDIILDSIDFFLSVEFVQDFVDSGFEVFGRFEAFGLLIEY